MVWTESVYLVLQTMPLILFVVEVEGREGETNFPEELVPPKPVPVPHAQPQGTDLQFTLLHLVLVTKKKYDQMRPL